MAALKIQLCPHLEGEGGKWGVIRPKSEALMHSLGKRGHPPPPAPAGPREGEGRAPKRSFPCGRATCHSGGMWELNRQPSPSWVPPHPFMEPFPHLCCPEGTTRRGLTGALLLYQPLPNLTQLAVWPQASKMEGFLFWAL